MCANINQNQKFSRGDEVTDAKLNNIASTATLVNVQNADVDASAAIVDTKLDTIASAGKVNTTALTTTGDTAGDFLYNTGTAWARLPVGTAGQRLQVPPLLDYMEYATDGAAQAAYVGTGSTITQSQLLNDGAFGSAYQFNCAQGFKVSNTAPITKITVTLHYQTGAISGTLTAYIYSDTGTNEPNVAVATFSNLDLSTLTADYVDYDFTGTFTPVVGTQYHIVFLWTGGSGINELYYGKQSGNPYANGLAQYNVGGAWIIPGGTADLYFKLYQDSAVFAYSEATIKTQGNYALKAVAAITDSLNKTLTRTVSPTINLSSINTIRFDIYASRTGANIKIGIHDSGGTTSEKTYTVIAANTWETVTWDISAVSDANKDAIDSIIVTVVNADAANTFYIDNWYASSPVLRWVTP
jgi:hypothetical protein